MRTRRKHDKASWRQRREEYLRSSGRYAELVSEGYESARPAAMWMLIEGGVAAGSVTCPRRRHCR